VREFLSSFRFPWDLAVAAAASLALGAAAMRFSPPYVLAGLVGGAFLYVVAARRPELGLLLILVATSSIIFEDRLPLISIGVGSLHVPDLLLLTSLGLILVRSLADPSFKILHTPIDLPLLIFYGMALLSTIFEIAWLPGEFNNGIRGIRPFTYYLTFFVVTNLVREDRQLRVLIRGLFLLAAVVALTMLAQFVLGDSVSILPGRVETLMTQDSSYQGITRVLPPGQSLILVAFITSAVVLVMNRVKTASAWTLLLCGVSGTAVILTFNRSFWAGTMLALCALAWLVRGRNRLRLVGWGLMAAVLLTAAVVPALMDSGSMAAKMLNASVERLSSIGGVDRVLADSSLRWRDAEYEYALPQLPSNLVVGLGMGAKYRPWDPRMDGRDLNDPSIDYSRGYIHNGHLWIWLKAGLLGYLSLLWLSWLFLSRGLKCWKRVTDPWRRSIVLGFTLAYLGVLAGSWVNPVFAQWFWAPVIGLMMGVNEVILTKTATAELLS
jgi:hypothetical protein